VEKVLKIDHRAKKNGFTFDVLFRIILDDTGLKVSAIAAELNRERSLIYKWLSGASRPPSSYFPLIAEIIIKRVSEARKQILENDLRELVGKISIAQDIRARILALEPLVDFITECMSLSVMPGMEMDVPGDDRNNIQQPVFIIASALFAAVTGGVLWNILNHILRWPYYMGSAGEDLFGFHALVWGLITTVPIPLPLLILNRAKGWRRQIVPMIVFIITGSLAAMAFFSLNIREIVESIGWSYQRQEITLVVIYSIFLSIPPLLASSLALSRGRLVPKHILILFLPSVIALFSLLITFLIDRPVVEIVQLRGFLVGFMLRLTVFFSLLWADGLSRP
jgi:hypothetical protein